MHYRLFIISFLIALLWPAAVFAAAPLDVVFEQTPLFSEHDLIPGQTVSRRIDVTNNSGSSQPIALHAANLTDPDSLASQITVDVTEGAVSRFSGNLAMIFAAPEIPLSSLAGNGGTTTYVVTATFLASAGNAYQGKSLSFDFEIGFGDPNGGGGGAGGGGGGGVISTSSSGGGGGGGGGGGFLGIIIPDTSIQVINVTSTSATIVWSSNFVATGRVIFSDASGKYLFTLSPELYGYPNSSIKDGSLLNDHRITLTGLNPATRYAFRVVGDAPYAVGATVSTEHYFTTLDLNGSVVSGGSFVPAPGASDQIFNGNDFFGAPSGIVLATFDAVHNAIRHAAQVITGKNSADGGVVNNKPEVLGDATDASKNTDTNVSATSGSAVVYCLLPWWWLWIFALYLLMLFFCYWYARSEERWDRYIWPTVFVILMVFWWYLALCPLSIVWLVLVFLTWLFTVFLIRYKKIVIKK